MSYRSFISRARGALGIGVLLAPVLSQAGYFSWDKVELPKSSGASCGNGTPYKFFVNRTPFTTKTIVIMEGGGACFDQNACLWKGSFFGGSNPNGIPDNYMTGLVSSLENAAGSAYAPINGGALPLTPFASRTSSSKVQTQSWNIVYMPQCTGDVFTGNKVSVYNDADPAHPLTYYHRGDVNSRLVATWMAANMKKPAHLLMYGFSAGAIGVTAHYGDFRETIKPVEMSLLSDSGPLFDAPQSGSAEQYPSLPLHNRIRHAWGLDEPRGLLSRLLGQYPGLIDTRNLASLNAALPRQFPHDRMGFTLLQTDAVFAAYSYDKFYPQILSAPTIQQRNDIRLAKWQKEIGPWLHLIKPYPNVGYYIPYARPSVVHSHSTTMFTFNGTDIPELGLSSITVFVDDLLNGSAPVMRAFETSQMAHKPIKDAASAYLSDLLFVNLGL